MRSVSILAAALCSTATLSAQPEPVSGDIIVWSAEGGKRVHRESCPRLTKDPQELAQMTKMTLAEARAQDLQLCSKCPGSLTEGIYPKSWVKPARDAVLTKEFVPSELAPIVSLGADGQLDYKAYSDEGDRILDFSYSGYRRSEVPIPHVPTKITLAPLAGEAEPQGKMQYAVGPDSYERIQTALDEVEAMAPGADGFRGAVLLEKGTYYLSQPLRVGSGVVLRGEGDDEDGTVLIFTISETGLSGINLGGVGAASTTEEYIYLTGTLSETIGVNGDSVYTFTLADGYNFIVQDPKFLPELKIAPFVDAKVTMSMKAVVTGSGEKATMYLKHNMPNEIIRFEDGMTVANAPKNLDLPPPAFGSANQPESLIADDYVPSGSLQLTVEDASGFAVGDYVEVYKTTNDQWIEDLGIGERLRHIRGGKQGAGKKPWTPANYSHSRQIMAIDGDTLTLDIVLPQSIAAVHGGGYVRKVSPPDMDRNCGVESLRIVSNYDPTVTENGKDTNYHNLQNGITIDAIDAWVRDCSVLHVWFAAVNMQGRFCTVRDTQALQPVGPVRGGRRYAFNISGNASGNLVYKCFSEDGRHDFVLGARVRDPNAFVDCSALRGEQSEPHHRWGVGTLYDNIVLKDGGSLAAINRGDSGSGHGWAGANTVFWNCAADAIVVFDPETKGENNFAIGYTGELKAEYKSGSVKYANDRSGYWRTPLEGVYYGYIESPDQPVKPASLFRQQLADRIGAAQAQAVLE